MDDGIGTAGERSQAKRRGIRRGRCCTLNEINFGSREKCQGKEYGWGHRGLVALEEKFGRLKQLMDTGKEKGYVLYDEVNELLTENYPGGRELEEILTAFD